MIRVPIEPNRVGFAATTDAKLQAADYSGTGLQALGHGLEEVGQAGERLAGALHDRELQAAALARREEAERIQSLQDDAAAKQSYVALSQLTHEIMHSPNGGYLNQEGAAAVLGAQSAIDQLKSLPIKVVDQIPDAEFAAHTSARLSRRTVFDVARIQAHAQAEAARWQRQQAQGILDTATADALDTVNTPLFADHVATGLSAIETQAMIEHWSPEARRVKETGFISFIHGAAIDKQMVADPLGARAYYDLHRNEMSEEDRAGVERSLELPELERQGTALVDGYAGARGATAPQAAATAGGSVSIKDRMATITMRGQHGRSEQGASEPRGADAAPDLPGDAPGLLGAPAAIAPPAPANRAGVERDLAGLLDRYGSDPAKAWAAYKLGSERVDAVLATHGDAWFSEMPTEVRSYVANNVAMLGSGRDGGGYVPQREELGAIRAYVEAQNLPAEVKAAALLEAEARVARGERAIKLKHDDATNAAYAAADQLGEDFTSITQLHPSVRRELAPEALEALTRQARQNALFQTVGENGVEIADLNQLAVTDPAAFLEKDLRLVRDTMTPKEYAALAALQSQLRANPASPLAVAHRRIWDQIAREGAAAGLDPEDPAARHRAQALFARMQVDLEADTQGKRPPTDEEIVASYDRAAMRDRVKSPGTPNVTPLSTHELAVIHATAKANGWDTEEESQAIQDYIDQRSGGYSSDLRAVQEADADSSLSAQAPLKGSSQISEEVRVLATAGPAIPQIEPAIFYNPRTTDSVEQKDRDVNELKLASYQANATPSSQLIDVPQTESIASSHSPSEGMTVIDPDGSNAEVLANGRTLDQGLKDLITASAGNGLRMSESRYESENDRSYNLNKDLREAIANGSSEIAIDRIKRRISENRIAIEQRASQLKAALLVETTIQNYFVGKDIYINTGVVARGSNGEMLFDRAGKPRFAAKPVLAKYRVRGPSSRFETADEAAFDAIALTRAVAAAKGDIGERTGYIIARSDGTYTYEYPYKLGNIVVNKIYSVGAADKAPVDRLPIPRNAVALWHIHPRGGVGDNEKNMYFGVGDIVAPQTISRILGKSAFAAYVGGSDGGVRVVRNAMSYRNNMDGDMVPRRDYIDVGPGYLPFR